MAYYGYEELKGLVARVLAAAGSEALEAGVVAANLVGANLRGIDSHGVVRLPVYEERIRRRLIMSPAEPRILRQSLATATLDGANGWGAVVGTRGMELAIEKARACGVGAVTVLNSNHFGYAAFYGEMALAAGMIGVVLTNANALMIPYGSREAALGTNPICISAPAGEEPPFVFDAATTVVARGKIQVAAKTGAPIPADWGVDIEGRPTTDPRRVEFLSPLGGYKGYDLAVAVDILCGILAGGPFGKHIGVLGAAEGPQEVGHFFLAMDIAAFRDPAGFRRDMDAMLRELRALAPAAGSPGVLIAGDPERAHMEKRLATGIPVPAEIDADLRRLAKQYGLGMPAVAAPPAPSHG
jgi:LDH2 family malate/lactate/ureidoglycolate dehydrogenase